MHCETLLELIRRVFSRVRSIVLWVGVLLKSGLSLSFWYIMKKKIKKKI